MKTLRAWPDETRGRDGGGPRDVPEGKLAEIPAYERPREMSAVEGPAEAVTAEYPVEVAAQTHAVELPANDVRREQRLGSVNSKADWQLQNRHL